MTNGKATDMKRRSKLFVTIILVFSLLLCACSGGGDKTAPEQPSETATPADTDRSADKEKETPQDTEETGDDEEESGFVSLSVNKNTGGLKVSRKKTGSNTSNLSEGWTIFVYMCGTDLESENGMATLDMEEMLSSSSSDKVRFVVQTGGTSSWNNKMVSSKKLQRFVISKGEMTKVDELKSADMGKPDTLSGFVKWGMENYASKHMGLVLWNHGGGSITGVCFDELYDDDSIDLTELDSALSDGLKKSKLKFDFVGFDACLMGTIETANILATYADYMYGSEELEPGSGWDYKAIGDFLAKKPGSDGLALGKTVADSFLAACAKEDDDDMVTMSVIDLSKIDEFLPVFNDFAKDIYDEGEDTSKRADLVRAIVSVTQFGSNNKTEGYTNMIDLGEMIEACSSYSKNADAAVKALKDAVAYSVNGRLHKGVSGLATYYPLSVQGSEELSFFGKVCVSPYYLSFVDRQGSVGASGDMYWDYDDDTWFDDEGEWYWGDDWDYYDDDYWDYIDDYEITGESPYITFDVEPTFEEGSYFFALDEEGWYNTADVIGMVYAFSEDGNDIIEYGETNDVDADWASGVFFDNFDGWWISLPDGQNLATYIVEQTEDSIVYTSPVLLNGVETNLRLVLDEDGVKIEGAWDGIDDACGAASRKVKKLKKGDKIVPMYYAMTGDDLEDTEYYGDEYVFDGDPEITFDQMYPGDYMYAFLIDDIYGDYYLTDFQVFTIEEDGTITF